MSSTQGALLPPLRREEAGLLPVEGQPVRPQITVDVGRRKNPPWACRPNERSADWRLGPTGGPVAGGSSPAGCFGGCPGTSDPADPGTSAGPARARLPHPGAPGPIRWRRPPGSGWPPVWPAPRRPCSPVARTFSSRCLRSRIRLSGAEITRASSSTQMTLELTRPPGQHPEVVKGGDKNKTAHENADAQGGVAEGSAQFGGGVHGGLLSPVVTLPVSVSASVLRQSVFPDQ